MTTPPTDSAQPLHLLPPDYPIAYGLPDATTVLSEFNRVLAFVRSALHFEFWDEQGHLTPYKYHGQNLTLKSGALRPDSYEAGVLYAALLELTHSHPELTFSTELRTWIQEHLRAIEWWALKFTEHPSTVKLGKGLTHPRNLDDCGTMTWAIVRGRHHHLALPDGTDTLIERALHFIAHEEHRLSDGTLCRMRPYCHTLWLDDLTQALPLLCEYHQYPWKTVEGQYLTEALTQFEAYFTRMYDEKLGLMRHGYVVDAPSHPTFAWGRANGWVLLSLSELIAALPPDTPEHTRALGYLEQLAASLVRVQGYNGFWHQLLDQPNTYEESSCTAIFSAVLMKACAQGWLDARSYLPAALAGFNALRSKITAQGMIEGTCVGTGLGFDPVFYAYRPQSPYAWHAYGPYVLAVSAYLSVLKSHHLYLNDCAVHCYQHPQHPQTAAFEEER